MYHKKQSAAIARIFNLFSFCAALILLCVKSQKFNIYQGKKRPSRPKFPKWFEKISILPPAPRRCPLAVLEKTTLYPFTGGIYKPPISTLFPLHISRQSKTPFLTLPDCPFNSPIKAHTSQYITLASCPPAVCFSCCVCGNHRLVHVIHSWGGPGCAQPENRPRFLFSCRL